MRYWTFVVSLFGLAACVSHQQPLGESRIDRYPEFQSGFVHRRNVEVWLPSGYTKEKKYAVLYMHDGQMLFDSTRTFNGKEWKVDESLASLMEAGRVRDCIVVAIWNAEKHRHDEYTPERPFSRLPVSLQDSIIHRSLRNGLTPLYGSGVQSDAYLKFIVEELKPFIDLHYSTHTGREHTFIAGSSMGGLISLYAICEYPLVFGGAACLSTHWPVTVDAPVPALSEEMLDYLGDHVPSPGHHRLYFSYGTEGKDTAYGPWQQRADQLLRQAGYGESNLLSVRKDGTGHDEAAWSTCFPEAVVFLLGRTTH